MQKELNLHEWASVLQKLSPPSAEDSKSLQVA